MEEFVRPQAKARQEEICVNPCASVIAHLLASFVMAAVQRRLQGACEDGARYVAAVEILESEIDPADVDQVKGVFGGKGSLFVGASLYHVLLQARCRKRAALAQ
ncbi:MAG TPA: hypothetical protein DDX04_17450 [Massilia sp.]|nr:hypothetical protein [Massilia sp.]